MNRLTSPSIVLSLLALASPPIVFGATPPTDGVMPFVMVEQKDPAIRAVQDRIYLLTQRQASFLLKGIHPIDSRSDLVIDAGWVRNNAAAAQAFAFLYRFGPYDEKIVGVSRKELLDHTIVPILRNLTRTHQTQGRPNHNDNNWGRSWQSTLWSSYFARAAYWVWDYLPKDLQKSVREIIAYEADYLVDQEPPHRLKGNTAAEENAWMCTIFDKAIILMPNDPRRPAWEKAFQRWALSCFQRPADEESSEVIDGRPMSEQWNGANIYDDFTLENHNMVHPDYMGAISTTVSCMLEFTMTGRRPPEALLHNVHGVFDNLKWLSLADGGCAYPNGQDWELFNMVDWMDPFLQMSLYAHDPDAWSLTLKCLEVAEKMVARTPHDGIFAEEELVYSGNQHLLAEELSREWLMLNWADKIINNPQPLLGVKRLDQGKLIIHRTPKAVHTFSWGSKVMAQYVPWRKDRIVAPDQRSGIGAIRLKDSKGPLPIRMHSADVKNPNDSFTAALTVDHGSAVRAELHFRSNADGTLVISETLSALEDCTTADISTGLIAILNNPKWAYEKHQRRIQIDEQASEIPSISGKDIPARKGKRIMVDDGLQITGPSPLNIAYDGARQLGRGRAVDRLYLNAIRGEKSWKRGQVISTYEATLAPVK
jgi:hypothetical protein